MNDKQIFLECVIDLMGAYVDGRKLITCPLCQAYGDYEEDPCKGCPFTSLGLGVIHHDCMTNKSLRRLLGNPSYANCRARYRYWQKRFPLLEAVPAEKYDWDNMDTDVFKEILKED